MFGGHVQQLGTPKEIYDNPANMFVAGFMGSPSMNLFPTKIAIENGSPVAKATVEGHGDATLTFANGRGFERHAGREIVIGLRPEAITDRDGADRNSRAVHVVEAPVEVTEPAGADTFVVTYLGGKEVTGRFRADVDVRPGQTFPEWRANG
jgi:multiple sugar transport system ATP-binding protein